MDLNADVGLIKLHAIKL